MWAIRILLMIFFGMIIYGNYLNNQLVDSGDKYVGMSILLLIFVIMPLFLFHRYRHKKMKDYILDFSKKNTENTENQ